MCGRQLQILRPPLLRRLAAGAKARYRHREVGASGGEVHALADQSGLSGLAAPLEAVEQPTQRPQVVWVDLSAGQCAAEPKILAINHLSLCRAALFRQQRTQRVRREVVLQRERAKRRRPRRTCLGGRRSRPPTCLQRWLTTARTARCGFAGTEAQVSLPRENAPVRLRRRHVAQRGWAMRLA